MYFDLLIGYKPDVFDRPQDFNKVSSSYDLVYIDHNFKDRSWLDIYRKIPESTDVVVLTTNSLHWYFLEFPQTIWKELEPIFHFKKVKHAKKDDGDKIKSFADTLNLYITLNRLIKNICSDKKDLQNFG